MQPKKKEVVVKGGKNEMEDDFDWGDKPQQKKTEEGVEQSEEKETKEERKEEEVAEEEGPEKEHQGELDKLVEQMKQEKEKEVKKKEPRIIKQQEAADPLCWDDMDDWNQEESQEDKKKK